MEKQTIRIFKLVSGDVIIGITVDSLEDDNIQEEHSEDDLLTLEDFCINISYPFLIISNYNIEHKHHEIQLQDWLPYSNEITVPIFKDKIITITSPAENVQELYESYQKSLEAGIKTDSDTKNKQLEILKSIDFDNDDLQ